MWRLFKENKPNSRLRISYDASYENRKETALTISDLRALKTTHSLKRIFIRTGKRM